MSTRANIVVEGGEFSPTITYYKHHDGYIEGGLGGYLAEFVKDNIDIDESKFMTQFIIYISRKYGESANLQEIEVNSSVQGDIEYMYQFKNNELGVYIREEWREDNPFEENYKDWKYVTLVNKDIYNLDIFGRLKA